MVNGGALSNTRADVRERTARTGGPSYPHSPVSDRELGLPANIR